MSEVPLSALYKPTRALSNVAEFFNAPSAGTPSLGDTSNQSLPQAVNPVVRTAPIPILYINVLIFITILF